MSLDITGPIKKARIDVVVARDTLLAYETFVGDKAGTKGAMTRVRRNCTDECCGSMEQGNTPSYSFFYLEELHVRIVLPDSVRHRGSTRACRSLSLPYIGDDDQLDDGKRRGPS
jgi:hypothetical protein